MLLEQSQEQVTDAGTFGVESVDYPDFAAAVAQAVSSGGADRGILVCGTGIGMSITANKFSNVRAALCHNVESARLSRQHNDANVLAIGARLLDPELALSIVREWMSTPFDGGRHSHRLNKIAAFEGAPENSSTD